MGHLLEARIPAITLQFEHRTYFGRYEEICQLDVSFCDYAVLSANKPLVRDFLEEGPLGPTE